MTPTTPPNPSFEQTLDHMVENLFDELATDLERVHKGKDTPAEYARNTGITAGHFQNDVVALHNAAIAQVRREELLKVAAVANRAGVSGAVKWHIDDRIAALEGEQVKGDPK